MSDGLATSERARIAVEARAELEPFLRKEVARLEQSLVHGGTFATRREMLQYWKRTHRVVVRSQPEFRNASALEKERIEIRIATTVEILGEMIEECFLS